MHRWDGDFTLRGCVSVQGSKIVLNTLALSMMFPAGEMRQQLEKAHEAAEGLLTDFREIGRPFLTGPQHETISHRINGRLNGIVVAVACAKKAANSSDQRDIAGELEDAYEIFAAAMKQAILLSAPPKPQPGAKLQNRGRRKLTRV